MWGGPEFGIQSNKSYKFRFLHSSVRLTKLLTWGAQYLLFG